MGSEMCIRDRLLALPEGEGAAKALDYIKNYPGITYEEVGSNG